MPTQLTSADYVEHIRLERDTPGELYAARSADRAWIKIGFSTKLDRRLSQIDSRWPYFAPFRLIGATPSVYGAERQLHRIFRVFHVGLKGASKEIYPNNPSLEYAVTKIVTSSDWSILSLDDFFAAWDWSRAIARSGEARKQTQAIYDSLPDYLRKDRPPLWRHVS